MGVAGALATLSPRRTHPAVPVRGAAPDRHERGTQRSHRVKLLAVAADRGRAAHHALARLQPRALRQARLPCRPGSASRSPARTATRPTTGRSSATGTCSARRSVRDHDISRRMDQSEQDPMFREQGARVHRRPQDARCRPSSLARWGRIAASWQPVAAGPPRGVRRGAARSGSRTARSCRGGCSCRSRSRACSSLRAKPRPAVPVARVAGHGVGRDHVDVRDEPIPRDDRNGAVRARGDRHRVDLGRAQRPAQRCRTSTSCFPNPPRRACPRRRP